MKDVEKNTCCKETIAPMLLIAFMAAVVDFQKSIGKTRDLMHYILPRYEALCKKSDLPVYLMLRVNSICAGVVPVCDCCEQRMTGNGRSLKYSEQFCYLSNGKPAMLLICTLCPQLCCEHCRALGKHYCNKILPIDTVYYLVHRTQEYEEGIPGDLKGRCLLTDNTIIRHAKNLAHKAADLLPRPPGAVAAAIKKVTESRGFEAVTTAAREMIRAIWGSTPPRGWYSGVVSRWYLRCAKKHVSVTFS